VTIPDHPPTVEIDDPLPDDVFTADEPAPGTWRTAICLDSQFHWTDNVNGDLGSGSELSLDASTLAPGSHIFTVTVTDSAGHQSSTNVTVTVQRLLPVPLSATIVGDHVELTWADSASTLAVWATFSLDSPSWFLVEGVPTDDGVNLVLDVPMIEDALYYRLADP
jgi:hypothetical protein